MTEIVSVRFKNGSKEYYFDPKGLELHVGDRVVVDTAKGPEMAVCCRANSMVEDDQVVQPLRPVLRAATQKDLDTLCHNCQREKEAMKLCQEKVLEHKLDMDLVRCECSFDGSKLLFFFTSEGRVDFRSLVKDLASSLHCRIELRQIGVRDESKLLGGLGICGRPYCCNAFLDQFHPVSIKMAKTQGLSLNPSKISGACGRLMCCLKYEQGAYEDAVKRMPKKDSFVETPDGAGTISDVDYLRERVRVRLENAPETPQSYIPEELNVIRSGKGHRPEGYVAPPPEELEKLRKVTPPLAAPERPDFSSRIAQTLPTAEAPERKSGGRRRGGDNRGKSGEPRQPKAPAQEKPAQAAPQSKEGGSGRSHRRRRRGGGNKAK